MNTFGEENENDQKLDDGVHKAVTRRQFLGLAGGAAAAVALGGGAAGLLAGCSTSTTTTSSTSATTSSTGAGTPKYGGTLRIGVGIPRRQHRLAGRTDGRWHVCPVLLRNASSLRREGQSESLARRVIQSGGRQEVDHLHHQEGRQVQRRQRPHRRRSQVESRAVRQDASQLDIHRGGRSEYRSGQFQGMGQQSSGILRRCRAGALHGFQGGV